MNIPMTNPPEYYQEPEDLRRCPQCGQEQDPEMFDNGSRECPCYACEKANELANKEMDDTIPRKGFDQVITIGNSKRQIEGTIYEGSALRVVRHAFVTRGERTQDIRWYPRKVRAEIEIAILEAV